MQGLTIDEALLDLAGTEALHSAAPAVVLARFALDVQREVGVSVSMVWPQPAARQDRCGNEQDGWVYGAGLRGGDGAGAVASTSAAVAGAAARFARHYGAARAAGSGRRSGSPAARQGGSALCAPAVARMGVRSIRRARRNRTAPKPLSRAISSSSKSSSGRCGAWPRSSRAG
jgi:hypothetical protein